VQPTKPLTFGSLIQRYRVSANLTQEQLAELAGLSVRGISDLERGINTRPRSYTLQQLAQALALSPQDRAILEEAARSSGRSTNRLEGRPSGGYLGALPSGPLIGRTGEIEQIAALVRATTGGAGRMLLIGGEPGIGKTRLAQEAWQYLWYRGHRVASGRCYEPERAVPYYPFFELLRAAHAAASAALQAAVAEKWPELLVLLPGLDVRLPDLTVDEPRLFHAVEGFLTAVAREVPLGLLLDDLHWADESSLRLLGHLVRHARPAPLVLLGTYRTTDVDAAHGLEGLRIALSREGLVQHLMLTQLTEAETAELASSLFGHAALTEPVARWLWTVTEGNPFYTEQVVRDAVERAGERGLLPGSNDSAVPAGVRDLVGQRITRLSSSAQVVLHEASILGQTFTFTDLQGMTGHVDLELDAALDEGMGAGFLRGAGAAGYSFHALTQRALYESLPPHRRQRLHRAAGSYLAGLPAHARQRRASEVARHLQLGGDLEHAAQWHTIAGDEAMQVHAHTEAAQSFHAALGLAQTLADARRQSEAHGRLARLYLHRAEYEEAAASYEAAIGLADAADTHALSSLYCGFARVRTAQGRVDDAEALLTEAERALGEPGSNDRVAWDRAWIDMQLDRVHLYYSWGNTPGLVAAVERMRPVVLNSGTAAQRAAFFDSENLVALRQDQYRGSERAVSRAREFLASSAEDGEPTARAHAGLGFALLWNGELDEAEHHLSQALDKARTSGDRSRYVMALTYLSVVARKRGDVQQTETLTNELAEMAAATRNGSYIGVAHANQAWIHVRRSEPDSARAAVRCAIDVWQERTHGRYPFQWLALWPLIAACAAQGGIEDAIRHARALFDPALQQPPPLLADLLQEASRAWDAGDHPAAEALLARALTVARTDGYL
jgi:transcriptional regulator with XRE-family HTH domain/tetratricopeptide (TPR) repeat protein